MEKNKLKLLEYEVKSVIRPLLLSEDNIALDFHIFGPPSSILLSSLLTSAGAALLDANIDMKTVLVSASAVSNSHHLVYPCRQRTCYSLGSRESG